MLFSCIREIENSLPQDKGTYTLTVTAGKDGTKALALDGDGALRASWALNEQVLVYKGGDYLGYLMPQAAEPVTTLSGDISGDISVNDHLTLKFLDPDYSQQEGTIDFIARNCDYALADVTVTGINGTNVTTTSANFINQQAIVKFTLRNADDTADIEAQSLIVTVGNQSITVTPEEAERILYVAIPACSAKKIHLNVTSSDASYMLDKSGVTLEAGKYYNITARLTQSTVVTTSEEFNAALEAGWTSIMLGADITLYKHLTIGYAVSVDLNNHTLRENDIPVNKSGDYKCIFIVAPEGNLTLTGGTLADADNSATSNLEHSAGAIVNKGKATLTNVTIQNCKGSQGGAIRNNAAAILDIDGCTITGNICKLNGGAIYCDNNNVCMQGANSITGNKTLGSLDNNVFLPARRRINVTGSLEGSTIGITLGRVPERFTDNYPTYNSGIEPSTFFKADMPETKEIIFNNQYEARMMSTLPDGAVYYIERGWDNGQRKVVSKVRILEAGSYTELKDSLDGAVPLNSGNYVVPNDEKEHHYGYLLFKGDCKLILCSGAKLYARSIELRGDTQRSFNIFSQEDDSGYLSVAEFMGVEDDVNSVINIHGGTIEAQGDTDCPGIGTAYNTTSSLSVNIYGGTVTSQGGRNGAGIGGYSNSIDFGRINIYGGSVKATGGDGWVGASAAGIGGGDKNSAGIISIFGGEVEAVGGSEGAGIGCGQQYEDSSDGKAYIYIYGGKVIARGRARGAGIGGGDSIGGQYVTITGGYVEAYGGDNAAGIGGGEGGNGGSVNITGGTVIAKAGEGASHAIGAGDGSDDNGSLSIGNPLMVRPAFGEGWFAPVAADARVNTCRNYAGIWIQLCNHPEHTPENCPYHVHN